MMALVIVLLGSVVVSGFGVGFESNKVRLYPGEVLDTSFILQNYEQGVGSLNVEVTVEQGTEYMSVVGGPVFGIPEKMSIHAPIRVTVPENAKVGDVYNVKVLFRAISDSGEVSAEESTSIGLLFSQRKSIDIEIVPRANVEEQQVSAKSDFTGSMMFVWLLVVIVVIVVIWLVMRRKSSN